MKKITEYEENLFNEFISLSNSVDSLYNKLFIYEYMYGRDSEEYKKYYDYLLIAIDAERSFIEKNLSSSNLYCKAIDYFNSLKVKPKRTISLIEYNSDYLEKRADSVIFSIVDLSEVDSSFYESILQVKKEHLNVCERNIFFELIHFINFFSFIDFDFNCSTFSEERKNIIMLKYILCKNYPIAEALFLDDFPIEFVFAKNDRLSANYLSMEKTEYLSNLHLFFTRRLKDNILSFNKLNISDDNELFILLFKYELRSSIFELGEEEALNVFTQTVIENNIKNSELESIFYSVLSLAKDDVFKTDRYAKKKEI